jgi:cobalt/nickel transport system permease protein
MHIPDGYLGPPTYGGLWAVMFGVWFWAAGKVKKELPVSQVPHLAMASAFSFVAMIFALPLPGGTTAHISGATLIAVLIGPWAAVIAISVSLMIQALVFGDGGITALAANCFNIAFIGSFAGYAVYRIISSLGRSSRTEKEGKISFYSPVLAAAIGAYAGINASALFAALELGLQPLIYSQAGYFPYSLSIALPAIMIPHLTLVGGLEALVAAAVIAFLRRSQTGMIHLPKAAILFLIIFFAAFESSAVSAHDFFIEKKGEDFGVVFGHGKDREDFDISKVKQIKALDLQGKEIPVQREKKDRTLVLKMTARPSVILVSIDNGYWSKTIYGWKELPKRKASRVVEAIRSLFFSKTILSWNETAQSAVGESVLEIIPLRNPLGLKAGESLPLKILLRGRPLAGIEVIGSDHARLGKTDKDGLVKVVLVQGQNLVTVETKERLQDDPDADALSLSATLTFEVKS